MKYVLENCKYLEFVGLMTIGQYGYDLSKGQNPDFLSLVECRKNVCQELGLDQKSVQLSMGMSSDYEHAVRKIYFINFFSKYLLIIIYFYYMFINIFFCYFYLLIIIIFILFLYY